MKKKKYTRRKQTHLSRLLNEVSRPALPEKDSVISFDSHPQYMTKVLNAIAKDMEDAMQKNKK